MENTADTQKLLNEINERVNKLRNYTPKVGVFGNSGVGKSSLCNALFGKEIAKISDVEACTRKPQEILIGGKDGKGGIVLVDVPGIGEDPARHKEYTELYKSLAPELDLVLWAIKADDRNYASGIEAYQSVFSTEKSTPVVFVITQADKINPTREWNNEENKPGKTQECNIVIKENDVSRRFEISTKNIISVSAECGYKLKELVTLIVETLPDEKKYSFTREAKEENVTEEARKSAEKGIWDSIKEYAGEAWDAVKDKAADVIITSAPKIIATVAKWIKSWW